MDSDGNDGEEEVMKKAILLLISSLVSFIVLDRLLYKVIPIPCHRLQPDKLVHRSLIPNQNCRIKGEEFEIDFKVNSLGLRDNEIPEVKPVGEYRILFLGDSFTTGWGVQLSDTFVKQAGKILSSRFIRNNINTINAGVPAYSPILEKLYLENRGIKLDPDLVVIQLFMNDFYDERQYVKKAVRNENGEIIGVYVDLKQHLPPWLTKYLEGRSVSYYLFKKYESGLWRFKGKIMTWIKREPTPDYVKSESEFVPGNPDNDLYAITRIIPEEVFLDLFFPVVERLESMHKFLEERGIPIVVILVPAGHQVDSSQLSEEGRERFKLTGRGFSDRVLAELFSYFDKRGVPYLDLTLYLKNYLKQHPNAKIYYNKDWHFTKLGHEISGGVIADYLIDKIKQKKLGEK